MTNRPTRTPNDPDWNRGRPENYAYVDRTYRKWHHRMLPMTRLGGDIDSIEMCAVCDQVLAVVEETRNPHHKVDTLWTLANQLNVPALVVLLDGPAPQSLHLINTGDDVHLIGRYADEISDRGNGRQPTTERLAVGQAQVALQIAMIHLRHMVPRHLDHEATHALARTVGVTGPNRRQ